MHVTQQLWDQLKENEELFIPNDNIFTISSSPFLLHARKYITIGKLLFWCLIHNGAWPHWLHQFHFRYIFDIEINYIKVLEEIQPQIYEITKSIRNLNDNELRPGKVVGLNEWGFRYNLQVIFNLFNCIIIIILLLIKLIYNFINKKLI